MVVEGDNLETEQWQVLFVYSTFVAHAAFASGSFTEILQRNSGNIVVSLAECSALLASSWVLADLGSGILHWSVDNYGNGRTVCILFLSKFRPIDHSTFVLSL